MDQRVYKKSEKEIPFYIFLVCILIFVILMFIASTAKVANLEHEKQELNIQISDLVGQNALLHNNIVKIKEENKNLWEELDKLINVILREENRNDGLV